MKDPDALQAAITRHAQARAAVDEWMHAEADSLRLRRNSEAPGWIEYQHALADLWVEIRRREPAQSNPEGT